MIFDAKIVRIAYLAHGQINTLLCFFLQVLRRREAALVLSCLVIDEKLLLYNNALTKKHQQTSPDHHSTTKIDKKTSKPIKKINKYKKHQCDVC